MSYLSGRGVADGWDLEGDSWYGVVHALVVIYSAPTAPCMVAP